MAIFIPVSSYRTGLASIFHTGKNRLFSLLNIRNTKLVGSALNNERAIEGILRLDRFRNRGGVTCFVTLSLTVIKLTCALTPKIF